jgi:hypothetical protein
MSSSQILAVQIRIMTTVVPPGSFVDGGTRCVIVLIKSIEVLASMIRQRITFKFINSWNNISCDVSIVSSHVIKDIFSKHINIEHITMQIDKNSCIRICEV